MLKIEQIAKQLAVTTNTVRTWIRRGELKAVDVSARGTKPDWRIRPKDFEAFLKSRIATAHG